MGDLRSLLDEYDVAKRGYEGGEPHAGTRLLVARAALFAKVGFDTFVSLMDAVESADRKALEESLREAKDRLKGDVS